MRNSAFLKIVLLGLLTFVFVPGLAGAASQGQDLTGPLASSAAERATAVSGPVISVSPSSHNFGRVNVGATSGSFSFTISNTGDATLHISTVTHSGPGFSATAGSLSVPAGLTTTLLTAYTASGSGPQSDNATIVSDATNGNFSVLLVGTANNAPVYSPPLAANYNAPAFLAFSLTASATDLEGDPLSWTIASVPALPVGATFDGATGTLSWTPGSADAGNYAVTITVTDGVASTPGNFTLQVTATNHPPVANAGGPYSGVTGVPLAMTGAATTDPDAGQTLTYAWNFGDGTLGTGISVSHIYTFHGNYIVSLTVTDNGSPVLSSTATTGATIVDFVPVTVVQRTFDQGQIRTGSSSDGNFEGNNHNNFGLECYVRPLTEIDQATIKISTTYPNAGTVTEVSVPTRKGGFKIADINANLFFDLDFAVPNAIVRPLLIHVPNGALVTLVFTAVTLNDHIPVRGTINLVKNGPQTLAANAISATPNPFKPETTIRYAVKGTGPVAIRVFSVNGQLVRSLREDYATPGAYEVRWNGKDEGGRTAPSGIYFVSVQQGAEASRMRVVLAR